MDNKFSTIKERCLELAKYKGFSREGFCNKIGMTYANFKGPAKKTPLNSNAIENILSIIPDVNLRWLLTGCGPMLRDEEGCPAVTDALKQEAVATDTFLSGTQQPIERNSNVGKCSSVKDPIDNIFEAASGPNIEVVRELMAKITEQAIEIGRLRERISLINSGIQNSGGGILPPTTKPNPPKSNPPAALAVTLPDPPPQSPVIESTSILAAEKSAHSPLKSR